MLYLKYICYYAYPYIAIYFSYYPCQFETQSSEFTLYKGIQNFFIFKSLIFGKLFLIKENQKRFPFLFTQ